MDWLLSFVWVLLVDAERYAMNRSLLIEGLSEVKAEW